MLNIHNFCSTLDLVLLISLVLIPLFLFSKVKSSLSLFQYFSLHFLFQILEIDLCL